MSRFHQLVIVWLLLTTAVLGCNTSPSKANENGRATAAVPRPPTAPPPPGLYVDAANIVGAVNPLVYGTNYGPWSVVTTDVQDEFVNAGLTFLRFPGGRYGDENNIREHHIDQLMTLADQIDAQVTISVRLLDGTPEAAAEMVRYTNIEKEYGVTYWSIGNEPSLYANLQKATEWDTVYYNQQWRLFAEAMRDVDPTIKLLGPNTHQFVAEPSSRPKDANGRDWMAEFLTTNGDLVDVVTFHRYPFPTSRTNPIPTIDQLRDNSREWEEIVPAIRQLISDTTGTNKPIGIMEINSNWSNAAGSETTPDSYFNAIWWGDVLGRIIRQEVDMVTHFALQHRTSGWGMLGRTEPRPTYFVYQLYQHFGDELLFAQSDDPYISIVAAQREDGAITIMLINLGDDAVEKALTINNLDTSQAEAVWQLTPNRWAEQIGPLAFDGTLSLPGQSMTLFIFKETQ